MLRYSFGMRVENPDNLREERHCCPKETSTYTLLKPASLRSVPSPQSPKTYHSRSSCKNHAFSSLNLHLEKFVGKQEEMPQRLFCWIHWCIEHKSFHIAQRRPPVQVGVYPKMLQLRTAETYIEDLRFGRSLADGDEHSLIVKFPSAVFWSSIFRAGPTLSGRTNPHLQKIALCWGNLPKPPGRLVLFQVPRKPWNISWFSWLSTKLPHHPHLFTNSCSGTLRWKASRCCRRISSPAKTKLSWQMCASLAARKS